MRNRLEIGTAVVITRPPRGLERFKGCLATVTQIIPIGKTCRVRVSLGSGVALGAVEDASLLLPRTAVNLKTLPLAVKGAPSNGPRLSSGSHAKLRLVPPATPRQEVTR